jgi:hypothetical protein
MPLRQAVFAFSMAEDTEIVEIGATPLPELAKILEDKSGACKAEIDPTRLVFLFHFYADRATIISGGAPWAILEQPRETTFNPDPQLEAEALFNKEEFVKRGFVNISISDEEAARLSKRDRAIREATGLVWRQYMLRSFDRAASIGAVVLYARTRTVAADFERLPAHVWALLEIADWQNGVAVAPDGTAYWSIHAQRSEVDVPSTHAPATSNAPASPVLKRARGRKPQKRKMVEQAMRSDIREGRLTLAGLQKMLEKELAGTYGVSRDTVRKALKQVVSEYSAESIPDK